MAVFVLISSNGCLIGLYTSPVDSAEMLKQHPGSTVTRCLLNAEVSLSDGAGALTQDGISYHAGHLAGVPSTSGADRGAFADCTGVTVP